MFYSQFILAKKGPLGTIWIAAHLERKLRKNQVADTDIGVSVDSILFPDVPIALRLSSHLLLGVVRIYSRKVNYLFDDCSEALLKIKQAFRSTAVDLPPEESTAPYHSITLPETFDLDDFELPDNDMFQGNYVDHHVSTREQITLQDTMDGVVFSTSQFGLDERFGDGDTSQIGFDIDEDLFLHKVAAEGNHGDPNAYPLTSAQPMTPDERDERFEGVPGTSAKDNDVDDQIEFPAANIEAHEQAPSPFTPAVECPSPLDAQETLACDGHMRKDHEFKESKAMECTENDNRQSDANEMAPHPEENGYLLGDIEMKQATSPMHSASMEVTREHMPEDCLSPLSVEHAKALPLVPGSSNGHINAVDGPDVQNNNESGANLIDRADAESPSCSQVTTELEDPGRRTCSVDFEFQNNMGESCSRSNKMASNVCPSESPDRPEVVNVEAQTLQEPKEIDTSNHSAHQHMASTEFPGLRACSTSKPTELPSSRGEESQSIDVLDPESENRHLSEPALERGTPDDCRKLDDEIDKAPCRDNPLENVEGSAASDFPAPEKLLALPEGQFSRPDDLLAESTPEKEVLGGDNGAIGDQLISGKKRSFTESTLTVHSLNSGESFSMNKSRRTAESIPGDDDLLSSILVGRKSLVLKMKPTPPAPEITSTKRLRSAPRASASKRKVLMDDMMVLHGDTIRQQLTNTEDIRRLRKKAPCTRSEISMLQRQFLEEEIFNEPIFIGMSEELVSLHRTFDFSRIKVVKNNQDDAPAELAKDKESSNVMRNDIETQNDDICIQKENQDAEISGVRSQQETSKEDAETDIDGQNIEVTDNADHTLHDPELLLSIDPVSSDFAENGRADILQPNIVDNNINADASLLMDAPDVSPQKFDTVPAESTSLANVCSDGANAIEVIGNDAEVRIDIEKDNNNVHASFETASVETGARDSTTSGNGNQSVEGIENNNLSVMDTDEVQASDLGCEEKDLTKPDADFSLVPDVDGENPSLDKGPNEDFKEADIESVTNAEITAESSAMEFLGDFEDGTVANDTEFLNVDDDEVAEDDEDYMPGDEDTRVPENSGWSSRTRAVSKYLQTLFDREPQHGRRVLAMDSLLTGKTRKEASRMFFETLVLKTKDYIHVEQAKPFDNINVKPRIKLMKSDF